MKHYWIAALCGVLSATAAAQTPPQTAQIGYLYPAGGQRGTTVRVLAGGQFLRGPSAIHVTGDGISAKIVQFIPPPRNLDRDQRQELQRRIAAARDRHLGVQPSKTSADNAPDAPQITLPNHPLWYDLDNKTLGELAHIVWVLAIPRSMLQPNRQLAESVLIDITIAADAALGDRELRIVCAAGVSNPMVFQVGALAEVCEMEPNNGTAQQLPGFGDVPETKPLELPVLINGQILPGDVDRFAFNAEQGQQLVIAVQARHLIPYLADAVPGWFQAVVTLFDADGKEVAFADDYRFDPDPVLFFTVGKTGVYTLEVRDAIYRGREDFVYRVAVGELPFITHRFPLGGRQDAETSVAIDGHNLPTATLSMDTRPGQRMRQTAWQDKTHRSNTILYAVDTLPETNEIEPNDTLKTAHRVTLPVMINGRIESPQDVDIFCWDGRAGQTIAAEVTARRLHSPLDSLLRLTDAEGNVLGWNDDYVVSDNHLYKDTSGTLTHHADSYLIATLPKDGRYFIHVTDVQGHGGPAYGYRLRISPPQPDFDLRITPSSLSLRPGQTATFSVFVLPKDGFAEDIEIVLNDAPPGFTLKDNRIAAGSHTAQITLTAPRQGGNRLLTLQLEGRATPNGQVIRRPVVPADERMQAFLYRHLVPAQELVIRVQALPRPPARQN